MYLKLRNAVVATMNDSERADWDVVADLPAEAQLELLISFVEHMGHAAHPAQTLDLMATHQHEMKEAWVRAGFTEEQSMRLLEIQVRAATHHAR
ncbi:hypothetical protein [Streptomyces sp. SID3212]|uniref:hypothetical protein n=1 Tax=Streptomyces sp. SID3212 TaxID=2690259 RepID=UPI0013719713|nr:hypothetical protein [Streptomyces sp. SID3212]MYV58014.1 hypothetical protein [Streptomyces sp. SID3212]